MSQLATKKRDRKLQTAGTPTLKGSLSWGPSTSPISPAWLGNLAVVATGRRGGYIYYLRTRRAQGVSLRSYLITLWPELHSPIQLSPWSPKLCHHCPPGTFHLSKMWLTNSKKRFPKIPAAGAVVRIWSKVAQKIRLIMLINIGQ